MLLTIAVILGILWLLGLVAFHVTSGVIHLVLIVAIVLALYDLLVVRRR